MHIAMPQTRILLLFSGLLIIVVLSLSSFIPIKYFFVAYAAYTKALPLTGGPSLNNPSLKVRTVFTGLRGPTSMAFLGPDDILVLEKNKGTVQRIVNGTMLPTPVLQVPVATNVERGMLGIAVAKKNSNSEHTFIFLFYTESGGGKTGDDIPPGSVQPLGNRVYRYEFQDNKLVDPKLILSLPAIPPNATSPETNHNGGKVVIGPDNDVYTIIGDVGGHAGQAQNVASGAPLDGTSGIFRVTQDGEPVKDNPFARGGDREMQQQQQQTQQQQQQESGGLGVILGGESTAQGNNNNNSTNAPPPPLSKYYYAYGIRNSFGIDFDPVTKKLWDTENGPTYGDEINLVEPGFNSGWLRAMGIWQVHGRSPGPIVSSSINPPSNLVLDFSNGEEKGKYRSPEFTWLHTIAPTALKFLSSDKLGKQYENTMFVGDVNTGNLYNFKLNPQRTGFLLNGPLVDKVANTPEELQQVIFGKGFGVITDIQVGPEDGYLYILTYQGTIYKIAPSSPAN
jgi:glucose/arabinose dehydrogenase